MGRGLCGAAAAEQGHAAQCDERGAGGLGHGHAGGDQACGVDEAGRKGVFGVGEAAPFGTGSEACGDPEDVARFHIEHELAGRGTGGAEEGAVEVEFFDARFKAEGAEVGDELATVAVGNDFGAGGAVGVAGALVDDRVEFKVHRDGLGACAVEGVALGAEDAAEGPGDGVG